MPSRVDQNRARLRARHYLRNATAPNHWFDFVENRINWYRQRHGEDFCLVINGSHEMDDAYVIPFAVARGAFTREALDDRGRWIGTIEGTRLHLSTNGANLNVAPYHNAFHLIGL